MHRAAVLLIAVLSCFGAIAAEDDLATYTPAGELVKPANYREWVTLSSGLNMAYGPLRDAANGSNVFTNVFVSPSSYRAFMQSGAWPERTVFVLEVRRATALNNSATGNNGYFQGDLLGIEAEVKDTQRFKGGWAFFGLNADRPNGVHIPEVASCYSCHKTNAAVENTFVQFYPGLREAAKSKGTLKSVSESF